MNQKNVNLSSNTIRTDKVSHKVQQDILSFIWVGILSLPVKLLVSSSKSTYANNNTTFKLCFKDVSVFY